MFRSKKIFTEKQIETAILDYLTFKNIFCWKVNTVGIFDQQQGCYRRPNSRYIIRGVSDILAIWCSRLIAIEVKVPARRNNVTEYQQRFIDNINANGGIAFVATSVEEVKQKLEL